MKIILASQSPRRKTLLAEAGFSFNVYSPDVEEIDSGAYSRHIPLINAIRKASAAARLFPGDLVIGADTAIEFNGTIIGKPENMEEARRILKTLSGQCHRVITGVALFGRTRCLETTFSEESTVCFKPLTEAAIETYLSRVHVLDKAGAYNIAEHGELLIDRVEGPRDNIIGLPCEKLSQALRTAMMLQA